MKLILTEGQYKRLLEQEEEILRLPSIEHFGGWGNLQWWLNKKGNPKYSIDGDLDLEKTPIESLGSLTSVGGGLSLRDTPIESLGNLTSVGGGLDLYGTPIESLGSLTSVGESLDLYGTPIESLGNLTSVGGYLNLYETPISKKYTEEEIREFVDVKGNIYL
jgi:hypothetical protein